MKLIIEINLDMDSTSNPDNGDYEIRRILREAGDRIVAMGYSARKVPVLHDCNGNTVGMIRCEED